jgi:multicomponent Na+:H+ antiporter subunit G
MTLLDGVRLAAAALLLLAGLAFMIAAAIGVRRLPDSLSRLHAVTKAETAGLALFLAGIALAAPGLRIALIALATWIALAVSGASAGHFIAEATLDERKSGR